MIFVVSSVGFSDRMVYVSDGNNNYYECGDYEGRYFEFGSLMFTDSRLMTHEEVEQYNKTK